MKLDAATPEIEDREFLARFEGGYVFPSPSANHRLQAMFRGRLSEAT
jgi:hypothetical protein